MALNNLAAFALSGAVALWANAEAQSSHESTQPIEALGQQKVAVIENCVKEKTHLTLQMAMEECKKWVVLGSDKSEKEIRDYFLENGLPADIVNNLVFLEEDSPELKNEYRIVKIKTTPGQYEESIEKATLFWDANFYQEGMLDTSFAERIEWIAAKMWEAPYHLQYVENKWTQNILDVAPNEDEAKLVDRYLSRLGDTVKPKVAWSWMAAMLGLDREQENSEFMTLYRLSSVYSVLAAVAPEKVEGAYKLLLPEDKFGKGVGYPFVEPTLANISTVNALLNKKIPQSEVQDYNDMYAKWFEEYKATVLGEIEEKLNDPKYVAKSVKRRGEKAWIVDGDTEEIIYEKLTNYMLKRYEQAYSKNMNYLYSYTEWDVVGWINQLQERAPKTILQWKNLDGGYEVAYDWLVSEQKLEKNIQITNEISKLVNQTI